MNAGAIILGIIIIILCYILYISMTKQDTYILKSTKDISSKFTPSKPLDYVPTQSNAFAYGIWVYVGNWDSGVEKPIFTMNGDQNGRNKLILSLDKTQPLLYVSFGDYTGANIIIMQNFPLQKWVYIIVSIDTQYLDVYIDGKLVRSIQLKKSVLMGLTAPTSGGVTAGPFKNTVVTYFNVWLSNAVDPGTAWKYYMKGNGMNNSIGYGADLQLLQNNTVKSTYKLF